MMKAVSEMCASLKSIGKMVLQSRRTTLKRVDDEESTLLILGNGPSLATAMKENMERLQQGPAMAVNFAANAPEFTTLRPRYYLLADPHFFTRIDDANVARLHRSLAAVDWPMTLFVPVRGSSDVRAMFAGHPMVDVQTFNAVGVEGWQWLRHLAYGRGWGMPRPRNVLIPAIMTGISLGFKHIVLLGADHSWLKTLDVDEQNRVVSVQPHFYKEDEREVKRVTTEYQHYPLHQILESMTIAFRSYHTIAAYAQSSGVEILNATPGSMIDAFPRASL